MSGLDPVTVLAAEVRDLRLADRRDDGRVTDEDRATARSMLTKVWAQDWRIVRLSMIDDPVVDDAEDSPTFGETSLAWALIDEWEPVG